MKKNIFLAALAAALALTACTMPPYNERLSLAQVTMSKLGAPVSEIGPVYANLDPGVRQNKFYFLPERDDPVSGGGFLVAEATYGLRIWYIYGASSYTSLGSSRPFIIQNSNENTNNYLLQPIKSASAFHLSLLTYNHADYLLNELKIISITDPYSSIPDPYTTMLSALLAGTPLLRTSSLCVGSGMYAMNNTGYDLQYLLCLSLGSMGFFEVEAQTSTTTGVTALSEISAAGDFSLPALPADLRNAFYGHDLNSGQSYLSYWTGSAYRSFSWNSSLAPIGLTELAGIKGRIEAVLSNGQLLSFQDGVCTLYNAAGQKLNDFPLGALKFCYEQWDPVDGRFELYFSLAYWLWGRDEKSDQLYVEVYSIPTTSLAGLK